MIVGIGELLWDVFPDGRKVAGGAPFNFAFHCRQLGHAAAVVSRVGDDDLGRELREEVRRLGLSDEFIQTDRDHPTGTVRVTVDDRGQPSYTIEPGAWQVPAVTPDGPGGTVVPRARVLCFGSLALRHLGTRVALIRVRNHNPEAFTVFDVNFRAGHMPDGRDVRMAIGWADCLKVNAAELPQVRDCLWYALEGKDAPAVFAYMREVSQGRLQRLIVTDGENGAMVYTADGDPVREPGGPARVVDTVGAGDAFTAAMVCLHLEGRPLLECARFANHYAARVCEHRGATPRIDRAEVERACGLS